MKDQEEVKAKQKELAPDEANDYETRIDLIKNQRTQQDIFNTDIPNYIQSLINIVLDDDNFHDVEFLNDVAYLFAPSNEILPGKRTIFKNEILKLTIGYLEPKILNENYTEEILFEKAKEFIKKEIEEKLEYSFNEKTIIALNERKDKKRIKYPEVVAAIKELNSKDPKFDITKVIPKAIRKGNRHYLLRENEIVNKICEFKRWDLNQNQKEVMKKHIQKARLNLNRKKN